MKANEFVKEHGWDYTRGIIIACESGFLPKNQNYDDLKRLVESHELVEKLGGLNDAKIYVPDGYKSERLKQAIAYVESCQ